MLSRFLALFKDASSGRYLHMRLKGDNYQRRGRVTAQVSKQADTQAGDQSSEPASKLVRLRGLSIPNSPRK